MVLVANSIKPAGWLAQEKGLLGEYGMALRMAGRLARQLRLEPGGILVSQDQTTGMVSWHRHPGHSEGPPLGRLLPTAGLWLHPQLSNPGPMAALGGWKGVMPDPFLLPGWELGA